MKKHERAMPVASVGDVPGKVFLGQRARLQKYPDIFRNAVHECRMRNQGAVNLRGECLHWYAVGRSFLVEETELLHWMEGFKVSSTAELPSNYNGHRSQHLPAAREKAAEAKRQAKQVQR